jgi:hypothetical protein
VSCQHCNNQKSNSYVVRYVLKVHIQHETRICTEDRAFYCYWIAPTPSPSAIGGGGGGVLTSLFRLFNSQNSALRAHRPAHRTFANLSGEINDIYRKPREKSQFGKNPRKCTTSHEVQYSNATGGGTVNLHVSHVRLKQWYIVSSHPPS